MLDLAYCQTHHLLSYTSSAGGLQTGKKQQDPDAGSCKNLVITENLKEFHSNQMPKFASNSAIFLSSITDRNLDHFIKSGRSNITADRSNNASIPGWESHSYEKP
jgi:hypothetical protein